ncbi:hypothetical protein ABZ234_32810 [Nocardiopsis sp. NPDC006198]|uniref:hypothetical protein n=1 Tax=Nocardiopsis sp. NPDC006198 TaxID=3154472 RepID=UPI0033A222AF
MKISHIGRTVRGLQRPLGGTACGLRGAGSLSSPVVFVPGVFDHRPSVRLVGAGAAVAARERPGPVVPAVEALAEGGVAGA